MSKEMEGACVIEVSKEMVMVGMRCPMERVGVWYPRRWSEVSRDGEGGQISHMKPHKLAVITYCYR